MIITLKRRETIVLEPISSEEILTSVHNFFLRERNPLHRRYFVYQEAIGHIGVANLLTNLGQKKRWQFRWCHLLESTIYLDFPRKNRSRSFEVKSWDFLREIQVINFLREIQVINFLCAFIIYSFSIIYFILFFCR
jgi:hypothetical protein